VVQIQHSVHWSLQPVVVQAAHLLVVVAVVVVVVVPVGEVPMDNTVHPQEVDHKAMLEVLPHRHFMRTAAEVV
jgi:formate hydrogenlyase subunit 4